MELLPIEPNPWITHKVTHVYESPWIELNHHVVTNPSGKPGTYSVVGFKKLAVGVVPIDAAGYTWIVGQYRYPLQTYTWEIPEGGGDRNVEPIESAKRELLEEVGVIAHKWELIQFMQLSNSASNEIAYIYLATDLEYTQSQPDEDEKLVVRKIHFNELYQRVLSGEIQDSITVAAVLKIKLIWAGLV
jgi:8-oxo-dGTP pyrophosphatase MutT (NUDIX family)